MMGWRKIQCIKIHATPTVSTALYIILKYIIIIICGYTYHVLQGTSCDFEVDDVSTLHTGVIFTPDGSSNTTVHYIIDI